MLQYDAFARASLDTTPFTYAVVDGLFETADGSRLAATYPTDHYRIVSGGEEKAYRYDARPFLPFGGTDVCFPEQLSAEWRALANDLASSASTWFPPDADYRLLQVGASGSGPVQRFQAFVDRVGRKAARTVRGRAAR